MIGASKSSSEGLNFLSDFEYLGTNNPSPALKDAEPDVAKIKNLGNYIKTFTKNVFRKNKISSLV